MEAVGVGGGGGAAVGDEADDAAIGIGGGGEDLEVSAAVAFEPLDADWVFALFEEDLAGGAGVAAAGVEFDAGGGVAVAGGGDFGSGSGFQCEAWD